jgi:hypothetical protein
MSTVTIVAVGIWNALFLAAPQPWSSGASGCSAGSRNPTASRRRVGSGDEGWAAFLEEHPELTDRRLYRQASFAAQPGRVSNPGRTSWSARPPTRSR